MKLKNLLATALGTTLLGVPGFTLAQSDYIEVIKEQLQQANDFFTSNGYSATHEPQIGQIGQGAYERITVNLASGSSYAIIAFCDQDCNDINISLYDENNNLIESDTETDDKPIVQVSPKWTGLFVIQIDMATCNNSPCYYGAAVYGQ